jgi:alpha-glucosidase
MRVHSAGDTREREPWAFGVKTEKIVKKFIELRYKLIPYLYSVFWEHVRYQFPMLRPLSMIEQEVPKNFQRDDTFTYGDKILVAPVTEAGATARDVYMPKGLWYNFWNFQVLDGNTVHHIEAPLDSMPIFVKAGSVIPEAPVMQYVDEHEVEEMMLNIYYAPYHVNSFMFEDNGDTFGYEQDIYVEKKFETQGNENLFVIQQEIEGMFTPHYENYRMKVYGIPFHVSRVTVDGKEIKFRRVRNTKIILFDVVKNFRRIEMAV